MKSLLDIQQDLRALEKSVGECLKAIQSISADVDMLRNENTDAAALEYDKIERAAEMIGVGTSVHPISTIDANASRAYLLALLNITRLNANVEPERFVFIAWLYKQTIPTVSFADLHKDCYNLSEGFFDDLKDKLPAEMM